MIRDDESLDMLTTRSRADCSVPDELLDLIREARKEREICRHAVLVSEDTELAYMRTSLLEVEG